MHMGRLDGTEEQGLLVLHLVKMNIVSGRVSDQSSPGNVSIMPSLI